jgi:hypothetical protein
MDAVEEEMRGDADPVVRQVTMAGVSEVLGGNIR